MFLLSREIVEGVYLPKGYLSIAPFEPEQFVSGSYTFRLGAVAGKEGPAKVTEPLQVKPGESVQIWSFEIFDMRGRTLGIIGNTTKLIQKGLGLMHSPCIDPAFDGSLELVVMNKGTEVVVLEPQAPIGKVLLFDVSESFGEYEMPADELPESYLRRKTAAGQLLELYEASPEYRIRKMEAKD